MAALLTRLSRCRPVRAAALVATLVVMASSAGAQTAEQLFDDTQVTDMHLRLSERDWDTMHRVDDDTFYAADLTWNGVTVRNVGLTAPREAHIRLFVNDAFAGVYVAVERIDRQLIERLLGADEANQESGGFMLEYR